MLVHQNKTFAIDLDAEGPIKVMTIRNEAANVSTSTGDAELDDWQLLDVEAPLASASPPAANEIQYPTVRVNWYMFGIGVSLINNSAKELVYAHVAGTLLDLQLLYEQMRVVFEITRIQIDSQILESRFAHLLYPHSRMAIDDTQHEPPPPMVQLVLLMRPPKQIDSHVIHIDTMSLALAEMHIAFDEVLLNHLIEYGGGFKDYIERPSSKLGSANSAERIVALTGANLGTYDPRTNTIVFIDHRTNLALWMLYLYSFTLDEIRINLTFKSGAGVGATSRLLQMGLIIANVDEAPLVLKRLNLPLGVFESPNQVLDRIAKHYIQVMIREWYKILGAAEFLGAPGSFISHLGVGFHDFFSQSAQGGLYTGTKSLVKHSVHAFANTTSKITDTLGTGMAVLSFDPEYQVCI
jgi:vacuolar protein sorting-associated protein 13A/C